MSNNKSIEFPVLKEMGFAAVIAPNYSVYEDASRVDHMYNIKRSMIVYNELVENGIPAVPDVSWYNKSDIDRWCKEINRRNIKVVAFSFQVCETARRESMLAYVAGINAVVYVSRKGIIKNNYAAELTSLRKPL